MSSTVSVSYNNEPWRRANLLSTQSNNNKLVNTILPGPFVILQGSPGDGMSNTLDSMPMLPAKSINNFNFCNDSNSNNRDAPSSSSMMNTSLHPLEELAGEDEDGHCNDTHNNDAAHTVVGSVRPHTPLDEDNTTNNNTTNIMNNNVTSSFTGRERSDSLTLTGGGLHYPLGEKSPIVMQRVRSLSWSSAAMYQQQQQQSNSNGQQMDEEGIDLPLRQLPLFCKSDQEEHHHHPVNLDNDNTTTTTTTTTSTNNTALFLNKRYNRPTTTTKTQNENTSIQKWHREQTQQELSHLTERNQNVRLLLERRKRGQERRRLLRRSSVERNNDDDVSVGGSEEVMVVSVENGRSGSPLATATSASSGSSNGGGSSTCDESARSAISRSRFSSPFSRLATPSSSSSVGRWHSSSAAPIATVSTPIANTTTNTAAAATPTITTQTIHTVTPNNTKGDKSPINRHMNSLELETSHRKWYQRNGRLVVFNSLPSLSLNGEVEVHPLLFESEAVVVDDQHQKKKSEVDDMVTLAPGTTVMAEEAITLDSHSLRIVHSTGICTTSTDKSCLSPASPLPQTPTDTTLVFLRITSPYTGYILSHIHNYPYIAPGHPTTYTNSTTWVWRVTCQPDGAFIRSGLDLVTDHIGTLPYGTLCCVKKKVVNYMGLNRLEIDAFVPNEGRGGDEEDDDIIMERKGGIGKVSGYISEFLNPLSGQRGNIVEQVSFPVPVLYKVTHAEGAIIRSGVELSTRQIGFAPMGSILSIVGRSYSSNPSNNCIERLRLAGGGGWISVALNRGDNYGDRLVEMMGVDESFDPEDPARFHFEQQKRVMAELSANDNEVAGTSLVNRGSGGGGGMNNLPRRRSTANLSEIGEEDQLSNPDSEGNQRVGMNDIRSSIASSHPSQCTTTPVPTLFQRSGVVETLGGLAVMDAVRESSSDKHHNDNANRCLICLSE